MMSSRMLFPENVPRLRACGLCASITHDSVELKGEMKAFLIKFLDIKEQNKENFNEFCHVPQKICATCFQDLCDAKRFKERCQKAFEKIRKIDKVVPKSFILGMSICGDETEDSILENESEMNDISKRADAHETGHDKIDKVVPASFDPDMSHCEDLTTDSGIDNEGETDSNETATACEVGDSNNPRAPGSRNKTEGSNKERNHLDENTNIEASIRGENCDSERIESCLKANPVVEISWNERQLAETHMKNCEMVIERVDLSQLNDKSTIMTSNSKSVTSTLHPRTRKSSYGRIIRESTDSSTYSYETSSCKKLRQHAYVSLKDSVISSRSSLSPLSKDRISKASSIDIPNKRKRKRKSDKSLVANQPVTPVKFQSEELNLKSSTRNDPLEVSNSEDLIEAYPCQGNISIT